MFVLGYPAGMAGISANRLVGDRSRQCGGYSSNPYALSTKRDAFAMKRTFPKASQGL
jgi:hypothetical protein